MTMFNIPRKRRRMKTPQRRLTTPPPEQTFEWLWIDGENDDGEGREYNVFRHMDKLMSWSGNSTISARVDDYTWSYNSQDPTEEFSKLFVCVPSGRFDRLIIDSTNRSQPSTS